MNSAGNAFRAVRGCSALNTERHSAEQGLHGTSAAQTSVHVCPLTPYFECLQLEHGDLCSQFGHTRIAPSRRHTHEHSTSAIPTLSHARCWAPWWQDMSGNARRLSRACKSAPCRRFMTGDDGRLETPCATRCIRGRGLFKRSRRMRSSIGDPSLTAHLSLVRVVTVNSLVPAAPNRT